MQKDAAQHMVPHLVTDQSLLERPRLDTLFTEALQSPALLVSAGEGWGKTRAVYSFLAGYEADTVWVQLGPEDNLSWRFWEHYTGALSQIPGDPGARLADLGFPETILQFDRYMSLLYEEVRPRKKLVTVFDDFHLIRDPAIVNFFNRILAAPPAHAALILISRTEPALNTVSFLSRGILARITAEELRWSEEETGRYFQRLGLEPTGAELAQIHEQTGGWPLGVDIIARELRAGEKTGHYAPFIKTHIRKMENRFFNALDRERRHFLIKLSLINYWPLELLEGLSEGQRYIAEMDSLSPFIRYDTYLQGYRIHHIFLEFLREKQGQLPDEEVREIHRRAAEWYLKNRLVLDAAVNYGKAGDYEGILRAIDFLPRLPPGRVASLLLATIDRMLSSPAGAGPPTAGVCPPPRLPGEKGEDTRENGEGHALFLRHIIRPWLLLCLGRFDESAAEYRKALADFEARPPCPVRSRILAAAYHNLGTLTLLTCRVTRDYNCVPWFEQADRYYRETPESVRAQMSRCSLGSYVLQIGDPAGPGEIERALDTIATVIVHTAAALNGYLYGADSLARAELAYYQGDLNRAEQFARKAAYQGREKKQYEVENRALFYLMRLCIHSGDIKNLRGFRRRLETQLEIPDYLNRYTIHDIGMGRFHAQLGLTGKIAPWLRGNFEERELNARFHNFNVLVLAWCLFAEKNYPAALTVLKDRENRQELESFLLGKLEMTVLEAAIRYHLGDRNGALQNLERAWNMAAPNSLDMPFIELGEHMRPLADAALARQSAPDPNGGGIPRSWLESIRGRASAYNKKLLLMAEKYQTEETIIKQPATYLTLRERKILTSLSRGFTREEIVAETGLSLNTVKGTIRTVYGKLGARNRADAIRIAAAMRL
jgi:LuxR family maltose regulon positive regulatory protein